MRPDYSTDQSPMFETLKEATEMPMRACTRKVPKVGTSIR